jgi:hypothetical protein
MNLQPLDYLVHFSNILLLVAYSVRDILWLRWFAVAAALTNIPYFLLQGTVLWPPILWALFWVESRASRSISFSNAWSMAST